MKGLMNAQEDSRYHLLGSRFFFLQNQSGTTAPRHLLSQVLLRPEAPNSAAEQCGGPVLVGFEVRVERNTYLAQPPPSS